MTNIKKQFLFIFADGEVGLSLIKWLIDNYFDDILLVVTIDKNEIFEYCLEKNLNLYIYNNDSEYLDFLKCKNLNIDLGLLLWWPKILKKEIIKSSKNGFINTHPSLLPFNRGKHFSFWAIVEGSPFGVTLHFVEEGIDNGNIIMQSRIEYAWEDTGETLYRKAQSEIINLFKKNYHKIRALNIKSIVQDTTKGSFHLSSEINKASKLDLNEFMKVKDLLNLLRAKTFLGHKGCSFIDDGIEYEIQISIKKI